MKTRISVTMLLLLSLFQANTYSQGAKNVQPAKPMVTFVELGSVSCIPCRKMQPIMKSVEQKYGAQLKVVFYDVWKSDQKHYAKQYGISIIPTQVFLDANGKEFFRHEGYYPEKEIDKLLLARGLKLTAGKQ